MCWSIEDFEILSNFDNFAQPLGPTWDRSHEIYNLCSLETKDATYLIWKKNQLKEVKHVQLLTPDADNERKAIEIIGGIDWLIWKVK